MHLEHFIGHKVKEALRHHMKTNEADINKSFKNAFATMRQRYPNYGYSHKMTSQYWWNQVVRLTYLGAGVDEKVLSSKIGVLADSLYKKFSTSDAYRLYPDTKPVLKELHSRNIKLGVISNSDERVAKVLSSLGIGKFWDFVLVSSEVGYEKPSPMIFQKALEFDDEIKEQEILHVGDDEIG
ncbi:hypothetical protein G9A89_021712 [Geosiphon pyriformis]|nr:hypothetical protein G9A89_021712 [Geosiphon pyriformis]